ncbi:MAG TPA: GAP family protein [Acidimicrobiia bacterium]
MGQGIGEVLTYAIAVSISLLSIIAVILMLFSSRARVNGPAFLVGWMGTLAVVSGVVYIVSDQGNAATSTNTSDTISWGKIVFGVLLLLLAVRDWRNRPAPGVEPEMPKWMASVDSFSPGKAFGLAVLMAGVNPKNLILTVAAAAGLAQLGLSTSDAVVSLIVFVVVGSLTIAGPVVYYFLGGERAKAELDSLKDWLAIHNAAVMAVLFLVFGVDLIAKGLPPLTS